MSSYMLLACRAKLCRQKRFQFFGKKVANVKSCEQMHKMCHVCGAEVAERDSGFNCQRCGRHICSECERKENLKSLSLDGEQSILCCKVCLEKYMQGPFTSGDWNPDDSPSLISPAISLTSFDSCASNFGEILADSKMQSRDDDVQHAMCSRNQNYCPASEHLGAQTCDRVPENIDIHGDQKASLTTEVTPANRQHSFGDSAILSNNVSKDMKVTTSACDSEEAKIPTDNSSKEAIETFQPFDSEIDSHIWVPPEPEDKEDDVEFSLSHDDDEDEYSDGTKWVQSSSLSTFSEENIMKHSVKEERQKAIAEVMNVRFCALVTQLLRETGVGNIWKDIVVSLSWEAAKIIKPNSSDGVNMDPVRYLKVKCIASEFREQSQVIKGLVFKKSAALKHMATKCRNPKLLLLKGVLEQRASGLSSFKSMEEEDDYLKSIVGMIEMCHPNIVLVEKTVSRALQESLLKKGITLVYDMKLPRLEKIARCTGSQIFSSTSSLTNPKLKHCDLFHIEKFVEEHKSSGEGGKKPSKTLMFFEGCPKPLGCTILLKGAHRNELKKVKSVVQQAVFIAYHSILDTSFLVDQRAVISVSPADGETSRSLMDDSSPAAHLDVPAAVIAPSNKDDTISDAFHQSVAPAEQPLNSGLITEENHPRKNDQSEGSHAHLPPQILPGYLFSTLSASLRRVLGDNFPRVSSASYQSISSYLGLNEKELDGEITEVEPISSKIDEKMEVQIGLNHEKLHDDGEIVLPASTCYDVTLENSDCVDHVQKNDASRLVLGPPSILILHTFQCLTKGKLAKQSRLSRIKYYGHFDMSLGRFLCEFILNKKYLCTTCGDPPDTHVHSYIHTNGKLTVLVRQLRPKLHLPGEAAEKIWMWSRCLKCEWEKGTPKLTPRVVLSTTARSLSFAKLLELSFSNDFASSRLSSCGHSLHRDCLHFYGLGSMVAMFRYSPVNFYIACRTPSMLEFNNPNGQEWLYREAQDVLAKGQLLFAEVMNSLQKVDSRFSTLSSRQHVKLPGSFEDLAEIEEMLKQEKSDFEASVEKAITKSGQLGQIVHQILNLNRLNHELLLELYVWDRRLHSLLSSIGAFNGYHGLQSEVQRDGTLTRGIEDNNISKCSKETSEDSGYDNSCNISSNIEAERVWTLNKNVDNDVHSPQKADHLLIDHAVGNGCSTTPNLPAEGCHDNGLEGNVEVDHSVPEIAEPKMHHSSIAELSIKSDVPISGLKESETSSYSLSQDSLSSKLDRPEGWIWTPFSETRKAYRKDFQRGYSQKFDFINTYNPGHLSSVDQLISQERSRLHFPVGTDDDVVSVYEDEFTSIIACALALSLDKTSSLESMVGKENWKEKGEMENETELQSHLPSDLDMASRSWYASGYFDFDGIHLAQRTTSEEMSGSDAFTPVDPLHPEISLGGRKLPGKGKYSVVCVYAKQFYAVRRRCCPSELDYISSLSRCKKWDAQGGKSKVFFAKTLDDRFIVKQVKKTELDSFLKFAPEYFEHISQSSSTGSQSCLAKILGIYQVVIRQDKTGKELKIDLVVMENLLFGRTVSRLYDLKGALHARYTSDANDPGSVLLDQNFVEDMLISPFYITAKSKQTLERAVWNDTLFLTSINVMDYSLLVGVDHEKRELVFGIIDYLRQYTWDKHLETWVKSSLVVPKNALPTVISPKEYKKRFRKFVSTYFLTLPDWSRDMVPGPPEIQDTRSEDSVPSNSEETAENSDD